MFENNHNETIITTFVFVIIVISMSFFAIFFPWWLIVFDSILIRACLHFETFINAYLCVLLTSDNDQNNPSLTTVENEPISHLDVATSTVDDWRVSTCAIIMFSICEASLLQKFCLLWYMRANWWSAGLSDDTKQALAGPLYTNACLYGCIMERYASTRETIFTWTGRKEIRMQTADVQCVFRYHTITDIENKTSRALPPKHHIYWP